MFHAVSGPTCSTKSCSILYLQLLRERESPAKCRSIDFRSRSICDISSLCNSRFTFAHVDKACKGWFPHGRYDCCKIMEIELKFMLYHYYGFGSLLISLARKSDSHKYMYVSLLQPVNLTKINISVVLYCLSRCF